MVRTLRVFDFDGTLYRTPCPTPQNHRLYEEATGEPWVITKADVQRLTKRLGRPVRPRSGWWGRKETLMPPLVPDPAPPEGWIQDVIFDFLESVDDPEVHTLLLTGRHTGLEQQVLRILAQGPLKAYVYQVKERWCWYCCHATFWPLGSDGPCYDMVGDKPHETFPWKLWIINQYRLVYPDLEEIRFWEDRDEHVVRFKEWGETIPETVHVCHVRAD